MASFRGYHTICSKSYAKRPGVGTRMNLAYRPERGDGIRVGPYVVAGQTDVLPSKRGDVGEEIVGDIGSLRAQLPDGAVEIDRVPVNDGSGNEAQARRAEALVFEGSVSNFPPSTRKHQENSQSSNLHHTR